MKWTEHIRSDVLSRYSIGTVDKIHLHLHKDFLCTFYVRLVSQEIDRLGVCSVSIFRALSMRDATTYPFR